MVNFVRGGPDESSIQSDLTQSDLAGVRKVNTAVDDNTLVKSQAEDERIALVESLTTALSALHKDRLTK